MSIKTFCDACGKERSVNKFSYLYHIDDVISGKLGYVDSELNAVSGRIIEVDLCNECYNFVLVSAVEELKRIQGICKV